MYRSIIESQGLGGDVGQLIVSLFVALHMLSELLPWDNSEGSGPFGSPDSLSTRSRLHSQTMLPPLAWHHLREWFFANQIQANRESLIRTKMVPGTVEPSWAKTS